MKNIRVAAFAVLLLASIFSSSLVSSTSVNAEGTGQFNAEQGLSPTDIYADVVTAGETIKVSLCLDDSISIWNTNGTLNNTGDDTLLVNADPFTANISCSTAIPNPITGAYSYTPPSTGTYRIGFTTEQQQYDFSVVANSSTDPDPTLAAGRIWAYEWTMDTGSFGLAQATDADLYILVPAPNPGENFVWKLDLNRFSGNVYTLSANSLGLDPPYSGLSASTGDSSVTPQYPIYLGFPEIAGTASATVPNITNARFLDDIDEDNIFSPGVTSGVQDTGNFKFNSSVSNANYAITIDTNKNGVYGTGDRLLLGTAVAGANTVNWDGNYPNGSPVPAGVYNAQIQIRTGEYHFIARDVETSGGTTDSGVTWANGLTIYRALDAVTTENTRVYWDDLTELSSNPDATSNVPTGVISGSTDDANSDGKADGYHTWGNFSSSSLGNNNNIDTYVYGPTSTQVVTIAVSSTDAGDTDGVASATETGAPNNGDGNNDGTVDFLQDNVTSLPNPVNGNAYNSIAVGGCTTNALSNVSIFAEAQLTTDSTYDYPVGLSDFRITCLNPGDTANVTIYYDQLYNTSSWTARKYFNGTYHTITGATFGTATVGSGQVTTLTYSVTDGGVLDADGVANGTIVDPVGPGVLGASTSAGSGTPSAPNTGVRSHSLALPIMGIVFGAIVLTRSANGRNALGKSALKR